MSIKAVVFDFDGVIVETEEADYLAWREIWARYGLDLAVDQWAPCIGTRQGEGSFSAFGSLCRLTGLRLEEDEIEAEQLEVVSRLLTGMRPLPGVLDWLDAASRANVAVAIASCSSHSWVEGHLGRVGLARTFPVIACFDDCGAAKPDPAPYLLACARLGVTPAEAIAIEDSRNGLLAATAAGLRCVVVPTHMTASMSFAEADLMLGTLQEATLAQVLEYFDHSATFVGQHPGKQSPGTAGPLGSQEPSALA